MAINTLFLLGCLLIHDFTYIYKWAVYNQKIEHEKDPLHFHINTLFNQFVFTEQGHSLQLRMQRNT